MEKMSQLILHLPLNTISKMQFYYQSKLILASNYNIIQDWFNSYQTTNAEWCISDKASGKYMSDWSRWWIGNLPDPHRSTPEYFRSSFEHSAWLYGYPDPFQSFVIGYLGPLIYSGGFYWIVEHPYLFQSFSLDRISTYITQIIFKPNIYIN